MIGTCFTVAWFVGMVVATPMYSAYPRLSLPLLTSVWLAAAGAVCWWMEANLNVHRRGEQDTGHRPSMLRRVVHGMVIAALALTVSGVGGPAGPLVWQSRTSLRDASWHLAGTVVSDVRDDYHRELVPLNDNGTGLISPDPVADSNDVSSQTTPNAVQQLRDRIVAPVDTSHPVADVTQPECVVYAYGEPAVLAHLNAAGLIGMPVQSLLFPAARQREGNERVPTYLVLGPNALRTPGMLDEWATAQYRFEAVAEFHFTPGLVTLYNFFSPEWVGQHFEASVQKLELYRLRADR